VIWGQALRRDRNLRWLYISLTFWMLGLALYEGLIAVFARQLGASAVQLGTLFTIRWLGLAAGYLIGWGLADRVNRRTLLFASWILGTPVPLMMALAPSFWWLLPGIVLYELTFFAPPAMHAYIAERVPPSELASSFSLLASVTSIGFVISPTLGGVIADRWGIRATLVAGFVLFAISTALVLRMDTTGPGTIPVHHEPPTTPVDLRPALSALVIYVAVNAVVMMTQPFLYPFLREVRGASLADIGILSSAQAVGAVTLAPLAGRIADHVGGVRALVGTLCVNGAGTLLTSIGPGPLLPLGAAMRARAPLNSLAQANLAAVTRAAVLGRTFALAGVVSALLAAITSFLGGFAYKANPVYPMLISVSISAGLVPILLWVSLRARPR
jgi:predicted MFS family arabinose efflux permease